MDRIVFEAETGATAALCESDADCPTKVLMGQPTQLLCATEGSNVNAEPGECYHPDLEISNYFLHATFGESYDPFGLEHPTRSVPISYCHINPDYLEAPAIEGNDFAYCILAEEPDVQPLPIMMHCEVDAFMNGQHDLDVRAVGFGISGPNMNWPADESGRKRWATSSTEGVVFDSGDLELSLAFFSSFDPGGPQSGDSGSPVLVKLPPPHDTWHVFGVMVKPLFAVAPWQYVEWMYEDPEVVASNILPCHEPDGTWAPSETCGGFPLSPGDGAGDWSFGPKACNSENVSDWSTTCGAPYDGSPLVDPDNDVEPPSPPRSPDREIGPVLRVPAEPVACSVGSTTNDVGLILLVVPLLALRRRRTSALVLCLLVVATGCPEDTVGS
ncbi:MAG TPA: hypothetical protein VM869_09435, partial [Enhygromyxa sp.]|nr:hypothetical protein [Enhygromyxa sp.]